MGAAGVPGAARPWYNGGSRAPWRGGQERGAVKVKIRRHRKVGDRIERHARTYEIVGLCGYGHYLIQMVFPPSEPSLKDTLWPYHPTEYLGGPIGQANLGIWVEDITNVRPYPFGDSNG